MGCHGGCAQREGHPQAVTVSSAIGHRPARCPPLAEPRGHFGPGHSPQGQRVYISARSADDLRALADQAPGQLIALSGDDSAYARIAEVNVFGEEFEPTAWGVRAETSNQTVWLAPRERACLRQALCPDPHSTTMIEAEIFLI